MSDGEGLDRILWLAGRVPWSDRAGSGVRLDHPSARLQPEAIVRAMASVSRVMHGLDVSSCSFSASVDDLLERATRRVDAGLTPRGSFAPPYQRYEPVDLLAMCVAVRPDDLEVASDLVVTHGSLIPANLSVDDGEVTAVTGGAGLGVGDRYRDLAVTAAALAEVVGPGAVGPFFAEYGIERPDPLKIDFFVLLSQFG